MGCNVSQAPNHRSRHHTARAPRCMIETTKYIPKTKQIEKQNKKRKRERNRTKKKKKRKNEKKLKIEKRKMEEKSKIVDAPFFSHFQTFEILNVIKITSASPFLLRSNLVSSFFCRFVTPRHEYPSRYIMCSMIIQLWYSFHLVWCTYPIHMYSFMYRGGVYIGEDLSRNSEWW